MEERCTVQLRLESREMERGYLTERCIGQAGLLSLISHWKQMGVILGPRPVTVVSFQQ